MLPRLATRDTMISLQVGQFGASGTAVDLTEGTGTLAT